MTEPGFDELLWRAERRRFWRRLNTWEEKFVRAMHRKARRREWRPSARQVACLQAIAGVMPEVPLIEDG